MRTTLARSVLALVFAVALAAATGCTSPCHEIQVALCECEGNTQAERTQCADDASAQEDLAPVTDTETVRCEQILPTCQAQILKGCETLQTPEGRQACGISAP